VGNTGSNPSVGCVVVKDGEIIAQGATAKDGRQHAEAIALKKAGSKAKGSTIYVTLEPCAHHGKTPPCASALIKAKPKEVVVACLDPDPRVNGRGVKMLAEAGIKVTLGVGEKDALDINKGFFKRIQKNMPYVTLKAATSSDGKYLEGDGKPKFITGELARNYVHLLRSRADCIITGTGTIIADKPQLNVRLSGLEDTKPEVIVAGKRKITGYKTENESLKNILKKLAENGVNNVLVEAGPTLAGSFIKEKLVDEVILIEAPKKLGSKGKDYFARGALKAYRKTLERKIDMDKIRIFSKIK
jgi:diaminohydroxyphosphoribosylaminopyrimidine deaminase/5-amino-6-(5-phosphoribosylamino)uracil reductase